MKKILETIKRKWAEYILEVIVIVGSILGAFALEQWNDSNRSYSLNKELLQSLQTEFRNNLQQLDSVIYYDSLVLNASFTLLNYRFDDIQANKSDLFKKSIADLFYIWTFDPSNGSLRYGISSGNINLLKNSSLLNLLFGWEDIVKDASENEIRAANHGLNFDITAKYVRASDFFGTGYGLDKSKFNSDYISLLKEPLFEDYLVIRHNHIADALHELRIVRGVNTKILELLSLELMEFD